MRTKRFKGFDVIVYIIATILLLIVLYPLILVVSNSISDPGLVASGKVWLLPKKMNIHCKIRQNQSRQNYMLFNA